MIDRTVPQLLLAGLLLAAFCGSNSLRAQVVYQVVINHEEQYAVGLADREPPRGWERTGESGTQEECQRYIREVWTDMRPLSIREEGFTDRDRYAVVINHEEQYLLWPVELAPREGWRFVKGTQGTLADGKEYIEEVWTDMRPLSLRKRLARRGKQ